MAEKGTEPDQKKMYGLVVAAGIEIALPVALLSWLGSVADERYGTSPFGVATGGMVGTIAGFLNLWKLLKRLDK